MTVNEIRQKYLDFFKARGHEVIPGVPLVPENDPTTLFVGSGMQPLIPFLLGEPHPKGTRVTNSQLSFRAEDIEEIGDSRHTTSFEMLGNWSLGDYGRKEQIKWMFEFLVAEVGLEPQRLFISCFDGSPEFGIPRDTEAAELWQQLFAEKGIRADTASIGTEVNGYERGIKDGERIFYYEDKKNWWNRGKTGLKTTPVGDPCGPDSEMFYDFGTPHDIKYGKHCHPNCDCGRFVELGNNVFMTYRKVSEREFVLLEKPNVDHGSGLERIAAASINSPDVFKIDTLWRTISVLEQKTDAVYAHDLLTRSFRIVADHIRGAVFMIGDGVLPSNTEQGYILRRLIRRAIEHIDRISAQTVSVSDLVDTVVEPYKNWYPRVAEKRDHIVAVIKDEETRFRKTLKDGMKEFERGTDPFILFTTYGFPIEMTQELAKERGGDIDMMKFKADMEKHQELSRAGAEQKFKGGLADSGEVTTMLHTSTHLMLAALRKYLGDHVHQAGSNITAERTRFDFTHPEKVSDEVLRKVEAYVNEAIGKQAVVEIIQMPKDEAKAAGVEGSFWEKYPDVVNVYQVKAPDGTIYSRELCGGPHVENTGAIKGTFKIVKEEASSAGVRRVKAILH